jgi:flagellar basal-body rod protein FlgF
VLFRSADGPRYTRNGSLTLNAQHQLVTLTGNKVLDENQRPIEMQDQNLPQGTSFQVRSDGSVFSDTRLLTKLGIVEFPDPRKLVAGGEGYFKNPDPKTNPAVRARDTQVQQGYLEGSNVDTISTMVTMMVQTRNYESDQKAIQSIDQTLGLAVNEVGKV